MSDTAPTEPAVEPAEGTEQPAPDTEGQTPEPEPAEPEPSPPAEPERRSNGIEKRFSEMALARRTAEQRAQQAEAELARVRTGAPQPPPGEPKPLTQAEFDRAVQERAEQIATQQRQHAETQQQLAQRDTWFNKGAAANPAFREQCVLLGNLAPDDKAAASYLDAVMDLDNGHSVTAQLAANPEEAIRILGLPPVKMGREIARLAAKPVQQPAISRAPAPIKGASGTAKGAADVYDPNISYADFVKKLGLGQ